MNLFEYDRSLGKRMIIGVDEVGRGCIAGPLLAAAVCIDQRRSQELEELLVGVGDSKKLTEKKRERLFPLIKEAVDEFVIISKSAACIDDIGIEAANQEAMKEAILELTITLGVDSLVLVDGRGLRGDAPEHTPIIKGDGTSAAVACASILAKVTRDRFICEAASDYPGYGWDGNKGYPSPAHKQAVLELGLTPLHRRSFCSFADKG